MKIDETLLDSKIFICRFKSRFAEQVQEEYEVGRQGHLSMGEAATLLPHPEQYLRKYQGGGAGAGRKVEIKQRSSSAKTYSKFLVAQLLYSLFEIYNTK